VSLELFHKSIDELKKIGRGIKKLRFFKFMDLPRLFRIFSFKEKAAVLVLLAVLLTDLVFAGSRFYLRKTKVVPTFGGTYTEGVLGEPRFINPIIAQNQSDKDLVRLVYSGLYKFDSAGVLVPDMADSALQISSDQKQYTVKLKSNLKWQDGQSITADDVIFTIQLLQNPDYKSPQRKLWQNIQIQKVDDLTIKFTNREIASPFTTNLTLGILPKHIWAKVTADNFYFAKENLEPVGNGPYFIKEINKSVNGNIRSITLNSYSNYPQGKSFIDSVVLKFYADYEQLLSGFHTKEVDSIGFIPFDKKIFVDLNRSSVSVAQLPVYQYQALFYNLSKSSKVLGERAVRSALASSIDRKAFIQDIYSGLAIPAYTPILPGQLGYDSANENTNKYDPNSAEANLDKAGWAKDSKTGLRAKGSTPLKFNITTNDFVLNVKSAENIQQQWKKIGVDVSLNVIPTTELEKNYLRTRNFDVLLFAESTGYDPDPFVFWHSSQSANPGFNLAQYNNVTIDRLITDARNTFDPNIRASKYALFQNIFSQDLPALILDQSVFVYESHQPIEGMKIKYLANPEDRFYDINNWYLMTRRTFK
jgi:peptide/nickel transport system substrate-binding protein